MELNSDNFSLKEIQKIVDNWIKSTGVRYYNELTNMVLLSEEVGELARIIARKYGEQSFKNSEIESNMADEMADILFVLVCLANQTGVDLTDAIKKNIQKKPIEIVLGTKTTKNFGTNFTERLILYIRLKHHFIKIMLPILNSNIIFAFI